MWSQLGHLHSGLNFNVIHYSEHLRFWYGLLDLSAQKSVPVTTIFYVIFPPSRHQHFCNSPSLNLFTPHHWPITSVTGVITGPGVTLSEKYINSCNSTALLHSYQIPLKSSLIFCQKSQTDRTNLPTTSFTWFFV